MAQTKVRVGTRGSELALAQTQLFIDWMGNACPDLTFEIVVIKTTGDRIQDRPLLSFGGKGVFVSAFEQALSDKTIDFAVHSAKDMPAKIPQNLCLAGVLSREDPRDVLVTRVNEQIPKTIATGSLRRQIQLKNLLPGVTCEGMRGNITTRLSRLKNGEVEALCLAAAGMNRLNLQSDPMISVSYFPVSDFIPAAGQGIIVIEGRKVDALTQRLKQAQDQDVTCIKAMMELELERNAMQVFDAGCHEAFGAHAVIEQEDITLYLMKQDKDGHVIQKQGRTVVSERFTLLDRLVCEVEEACL